MTELEKGPDVIDQPIDLAVLLGRAARQPLSMVRACPRPGISTIPVTSLLWLCCL